MKNIFQKVKNSLSFLLEKILWLQTTLILMVVYFLILGPVSILAKVTGRDFLKKGEGNKSFWQNKKLSSATIDHARKLY